MENEIGQRIRCFEPSGPGPESVQGLCEPTSPKHETYGVNKVGLYITHYQSTHISSVSVRVQKEDVGLYMSTS